MNSEVKLSRKQIVWNLIILTAVMITAIEAPFSITFKTKLQSWQVVLDVILSSIFFCDVIYQINCKISGRIKLTTTTEKIKWYAMLCIDIIASIPFELLSFYVGAQSVRLFNVLRLLRMIRIVRLIQLFSQVTVVPKTLRINIFIVSFMMAVHWISCAWVRIEPVIGLDQNSQYIRAMYWTVTTLTTIGYGDITPSTNIGRLFTMIVMIAGVGVYGVVIGNVSRMMVAGEKHKERARENMTDLSSFMKYYNIPERLQQNVIVYYQHMLTKRLTDNDNKVINQLPQALQSELKIYMNMKLIRSLPIFRDCSQQCLKDLAGAMKQMYFGPGQTIINIGEIGEEMYIIGHGLVEVILKDGSTVATLHEGQFFGEAALIKDTKRNANVRAQNYCDLYKLDKESFDLIVERHPDLYESIQNISHTRKNDRRRPSTRTDDAQG